VVDGFTGQCRAKQRRLALAFGIERDRRGG
jgi:hypothetical protein